MERKTILIVEDNEDIREIIGIILEDQRYELIMCGTARCLHNELGRMPDAIILDIMLPDGNGLDLCKQIKDDPMTQKIPVLLMSAHEDMLGKQSKADTFISKPFDIEKFKFAVDSYL
jgi:two-component system phosphate regulon response regulator PhoB